MTSKDATEFIPPRPALPKLRKAVQLCEGCDLYKCATQAVFGEGPAASKIVFIGEQPGDQEDLQGHPFVGPAGKLFDRALQQAGIERSGVYITNAVKHFKFEERGKRRIHQKPNSVEITACRPWLEAEILLIKPRIIVCLGATAAQSILGKQYRVTKQRGQFIEHPLAPHVTSTVHPSTVLRAPDAEQREIDYRLFVADLQKVRDMLNTSLRSK